MSNHPEHPYSWANVPNKLISLFSDRIQPETKRGFMEQAISEARKSNLRPTVGSIIVKNNKIIARGYRRVKKLRDEPPLWRVVHAEQAALESAGQEANGATLYVTLEPCAGRYQGPTVEAAEVCSAIIPQAGITTVVIGLVDRDPQTFGKGLRRLHDAGVQLEYAYHGLEHELVGRIGDGQFGVLRPKLLTVLRKWMNAWGVKRLN
jgi:pyrimidine deaminase RibD-like protein